MCGGYSGEDCGVLKIWKAISNAKLPCQRGYILPNVRQTYASWALQSGIAPENLQKILGHKKFATTAEIYYHSNADALVSTVLNASNRVSNRKQTATDEN